MIYINGQNSIKPTHHKWSHTNQKKKKSDKNTIPNDIDFFFLIETYV